jgi:hypothetical protein
MQLRVQLVSSVRSSQVSASEPPVWPWRLLYRRKERQHIGPDDQEQQRCQATARGESVPLLEG